MVVLGHWRLGARKNKTPLEGVFLCRSTRATARDRERGYGSFSVLALTSTFF